MKSTVFHKLLIVCLTLSLALMSFDLLSEDEIEEQKKMAQQELLSLKDKIKNLQSSLIKKRKQQSSALKQLRKSEKQIAMASKILRSTKKQLQKKGSELKELRKKQLNLQRNKNKQKKALAEQIRSVYMNGQQEYIKLLLNQENPEELGRMLVYYSYMNKARSQQVKILQATLIELKKIDEAVQKEIKKLDLLRSSKENETKQLKKLKAKRKKLVESLAKEIVSKNDELTELEINAQELQQLIDTVTETIEKMDFTQPLEGLKKVKGQLKWPTSGKQTRRFGSTQNGLKSAGILFLGTEGKELNAIHYGRVVYADWLRGFGLLLIIDHGKGYMSLYGYNQSLYKDVGDWVDANEVIATLGQSGGQKQPALYFELRHQGKPINPKRWFKK